MKIPFPHRTIVSAVYTPASERADGGEWDVTYVTFAECGHVMHGNPTFEYRIGAKRGCYDCACESAATREP